MIKLLGWFLLLLPVIFLSVITGIEYGWITALIIFVYAQRLLPL